MSAWFKTTQDTANGGDTGRADLVSRGDHPYNSGMTLSLLGNRVGGFVEATQRQGATLLGHPTNDGQWHHIVVTRQDGQVRTFAQGNVTQSYMAPGSVDVDTPLVLGKHGSFNLTYFNGVLDDVKIWRVALTQPQVMALGSLCVE